MCNNTFLYAQDPLPDEDSIPLYTQQETATGLNPETSEVTAPALDIPVGDYIKMILVLAGVIGAIYLVFFLLKKGVRKRLPENSSIKILASCSLRGNSLLYLVETGTNIFLLGSGDGSLNLISEIKDKESLDTIRLAAAGENTGKKQPFSEMLLNFFKPAGKTQTLINGQQTTTGTAGSGDTYNLENVNRENPLDFIKRQKSRLQKMR